MIEFMGVEINDIYFTRAEFACKCGCGQDTVDFELMNVLHDIRLHFGMPVKINSGVRCFMHNLKIGGSEKSYHILGKAADIVVVGVSPENVYIYLQEKYPECYGIGKYTTFTHIDVRKKKARW